jgi:HK97 family phage major capsid protein
VQTIDSKRTITVEASTPAAALVSEEGAITPADHTFSAVSVTPYKFVAATTMTQEFIEDSIGNNGIGSGLEWVADRLGISLAREMDEYYTIGSGASEPQGIADTSSTAWATTNSGRIINQGVALTEDQTVANITGDNIIDCVHSVAPQYRTGPRFRILLHDGCVKAIRKIKVNTTDYVWKPSETGGISGGAPGTIYGVPYAISEWMPTTAAQTATGANVRGSALFIVGNFEYFGIFDRTGMTQLVDPYSGSNYMRTTLYISMRTDSKILLPEAFAAIYAPNAS